jgi:hypothetical protein
VKVKVMRGGWWVYGEDLKRARRGETTSSSQEEYGSGGERHLYYPCLASCGLDEEGEEEEETTWSRRGEAEERTEKRVGGLKPKGGWLWLRMAVSSQEDDRDAGRLPRTTSSSLRDMAGHV